MKKEINAIAIILAGGNGERFWPLSTPKKPKQFLSLFDGKTLIEHAVDRLDGLFKSEKIFVLTSENFVNATRRVLPKIPKENIIGEPCRRDTASAVATACAIAIRQNNAVACVLPADHIIKNKKEFRNTLLKSIRVANEKNSIVTIGIAPTKPDVNFGYIEVGEEIKRASNFYQVSKFVEKPDEKTAKKYLASKKFLWNSGMFVFRADTMLRAFQNCASSFVPLVKTLSLSKNWRKDMKAIYPSMPKISIDFAVMQRARNIIVSKCHFDWDDVGNYLALEKHFEKNADNSILLGKAITSDISNAIVVNTEKAHIVAVSGLSDVVVVHTKNATLVCHKDALKNIKAIVSRA